MRAFVGVMISDEVRAALESTVEPLKAIEPNLTWERPERWHLTLTFMGNIGLGVVDAMRPRLARAASRTTPMSLTVDELGRFGRRVLFAKVGGERVALRRLAERTTAATRRSGVDIGDERFRPHVTVARSRHGADLRALVESAAPVDATFTVTEFCLVESVLGANRSYTVLETFPLTP